MAEKTTTIRVVGKDDASKTFETVSRNSAKAAGEMEGHSLKIGKAFGSLDNLLGQFGIPFTGALTTIGAKLDETEKKAESSGASFASKLSGFGAAGAAGVALAAGAIAVESIHLADSFEIAQSRLETAIQNTGGSFDKLKPQIDAGYSSMAKYGYNATEVAGALATLTGLTRDPAKAISLLGDTANFAAFYNKDLATSAQAVGLAAEGQMGRLKRLVGDLGLTAGGTTNVTKAQDALTKANNEAALVEQKVADGRIKAKDATPALIKAYADVMGAQDKLTKTQQAGSNILEQLSMRDMDAADKRAATFAGSLKGLQAELENVGIKIGLALIPYVKKMMDGLQEAVAWVQAHREDFKRFFDDVANVVQSVWRVVGPIYKKLAQGFQDLVRLIDDLINGRWGKIWDDFTRLVGDQIDAVIAYAKAIPGRILSAIGDLAGLLLQKGLDLIGGLLTGINNRANDVWTFFTSTLPNAVIDAFSDAGNWLIDKGTNIISGLLTGVVGRFYDVTGWFGGVGGAIVSAIGDLSSTLWDVGSNLIGGLWDGIRSAWNAAADKATFSLPEVHIPGTGVDIGGGSVSLLPHIASGVTNFVGGLAVVGEEGPELAWLPTGTQVTPHEQSVSALRGGGRGGENLYVQVILDGHVIGETAVKHINRRAQGNPVIVKAAVRNY